MSSAGWAAPINWWRGAASNRPITRWSPAGNWGSTSGIRCLLGLHTYHRGGPDQGASISGRGTPGLSVSPGCPGSSLSARQRRGPQPAATDLRRPLAPDLLIPGEAEKLLPRLQSDTHIINAILVKVAPGADRAEMARHIKNWLYFSAYTTTGEEIELMLKGRLPRHGQTASLIPHPPVSSSPWSSSPW